MQRIIAAPVTTTGLHVSYESPSQGRLEFGWKGALLQNQVAVPLHDYPRYDNPFAQAALPAERVDLHHGIHRLTLDWQRLQRTMDRSLTE